VAGGVWHRGYMQQQPTRPTIIIFIIRVCVTFSFPIPPRTFTHLTTGACLAGAEEHQQHHPGGSSSNSRSGWLRGAGQRVCVRVSSKQT
jgi:hypothetical protein